MNIIENPTIGQISEMKKFEQFTCLNKTWTVVRNETYGIDGQKIQRVYFTHCEYKHNPMETYSNYWVLIFEEGQTFGTLFVPVISTLNAKCIKEVSFSIIFNKLLRYHNQNCSLFENFTQSEKMKG